MGVPVATGGDAMAEDTWERDVQSCAFWVGSGGGGGGPGTSAMALGEPTGSRYHGGRESPGAAWMQMLWQLRALPLCGDK